MDFKEEEIESFHKAGKIARKAQDYGREITCEGALLADICEKIEGKIVREGGGIAFPVNVSLNECAAHYTAKFEDATRIGGKDVLKVDLGVHVDGFIADCAFTFSPSSEHDALINASKAALEAAVGKMTAGTSVYEVGKAIETSISSAGFKPVENLCGHSLAKNRIHAGREIPNVARGSYVLREGDVFAVEPFASTGKGQVHDGNECEIFALAKKGVKARAPFSRELIEFMEANFDTRPFALRWLLINGFAQSKVENALSELVRSQALRAYPVLKDVSSSLVSQAETSVIVGKERARDLLSV